MIWADEADWTPDNFLTASLKLRRVPLLAKYGERARLAGKAALEHSEAALSALASADANASNSEESRRTALALLLGLSPQQLDDDATLSELGVDSLTTLRLARTLGLPTNGSLTISDW